MEISYLIDGIELSYLLSPTKVTVLRSLGKVPFAEEYSLTRGIEAEIPRWLAEVLEKMGFVEISPDEKLRLENLARAKMVERDMERRGLRAIAKLHPYFYTMAKSLMRTLEHRAKESLDLSVLKELDMMKTSLYEILKLRLGKILDAALMGTLSHELLENMTLEERVLFKLIASIIKSWHRIIGVEE